MWLKCMHNHMYIVFIAHNTVNYIIKYNLFWTD